MHRDLLRVHTDLSVLFSGTRRGSCSPNNPLSQHFPNFFLHYTKTLIRKSCFTAYQKVLFKCPCCDWVMGPCVIIQRKYTFTQFWVIYLGLGSTVLGSEVWIRSGNILQRNLEHHLTFSVDIVQWLKICRTYRP